METYLLRDVNVVSSKQRHLAHYPPRLTEKAFTCRKTDAVGEANDGEGSHDAYRWNNQDHNERICCKLMEVVDNTCPM